MAYKTGKFPAQGKLMLTPTGYDGTTGTNLGIVAEGHLAGLDMSMDVFDKHPQGSTAQDARVTGVNALYQVTLLDSSASLLALLFRNMNTTNSFQAFNGYKLGHLLSSSQTSKLLIVPTIDAGTTQDATKPHFYAQRAVVQSVLPVVWDRGDSHFEATQLRIVCLKHASLDVPFLYGDPALFPAFA